MISIFKDLIELIVNPGAGHAVRGELGDLYQKNKPEYEKRAREWAQKNLQPIK